MVIPEHQTPHREGDRQFARITEGFDLSSGAREAALSEIP